MQDRLACIIRSVIFMSAWPLNRRVLDALCSQFHIGIQDNPELLAFPSKQSQSGVPPTTSPCGIIKLVANNVFACVKRDAHGSQELRGGGECGDCGGENAPYSGSSDGTSITLSFVLGPTYVLVPTSAYV